MSAYAKQLAALQDAMVHERPETVLPHIRPERAEDFPPVARFAVYGDGYYRRLEDAVREDYPTLEHYLGAKDMTQLLRAFVRSTPSQEWDLNQYPPLLAHYVTEAKMDAALVALAQLEAAITQVFWMPESDALDAQSLVSLPPEALEQRCFSPRTALRMLQFEVAANRYLQAFRDGAPLGAMPVETEYLCVVRHANEVRRLVLEPLEYRLLQHLFAGIPFANAFSDVSEADAEKVNGYLSRWLQNGVFAA
jgi:hypothetical protein